MTLPIPHLVRRFVTSLSSSPPGPADDVWARRSLGESEVALWESMPSPDRRHSIEVARRFAARRPGATRAELAGALLHDVGKVSSGLGTFGRVAATVIGPRTDRFASYHDHEAIGAHMAREAGSDPVTVALIGGAGPAAADLRRADDI